MTQRPEPYAASAERRRRSTPSSALEAIAREREVSMAGAALAWLLADERVTQVVTGPGRPEHLAPVREALEQPLTGAERASSRRHSR